MKVQIKMGSKTTDLPIDQLPADALVKFGELFGMLNILDDEGLGVGNSSFELYLENNGKYIVIGKKK